MFAVVADWDHDFFISKGQERTWCGGENRCDFNIPPTCFGLDRPLSEKKKHVKFEVEITSVLH